MFIKNWSMVIHGFVISLFVEILENWSVFTILSVLSSALISPMLDPKYPLYLFSSLCGKLFFLICQHFLSISVFLISLIVWSNVKISCFKISITGISYWNLEDYQRLWTLLFSVITLFFPNRPKKDNTQENVAGWWVKGKWIRKTHAVDIWPQLLCHSCDTSTTWRLDQQWTYAKVEAKPQSSNQTWINHLTCTSIFLFLKWKDAFSPRGKKY